MLELPAVVLSVAIDPSLSPIDVRVYLVASQHLDHVEFRPLKLAAVALPIGLARSSAHDAIRRLCEQGYLERGPRMGARRTALYRLTPRLAVFALANNSHLREGLRRV